MDAHFTPVESSIEWDNLVIGTYDARKVVIAAGAGVLKRGTVLGEVSATPGTFTIAKKTAADGSAEPDRILAEDVDATNGAVEAVAFHAGRFNQWALVLGDGMTLGAIDKPFRLRSIYLENPMA